MTSDHDHPTGPGSASTGGAHDHAHGHSHAHAARDLRPLSWTLALVLLYMVAEVVGGLLTNSLALLADAGHMLSDAGSLALALFAMWIARRPRTPQRTFGTHRTEILVALANGVTLVVIAIFILIEAFHRLREPRDVDGATMMWIAVGGLFVNLAGLWILHGGRDASLNLRGAWLHVLADALGSVQAIAAGALIWGLGWNLADPVASVLIAFLVAGSSWALLRDAVHVLMEGTPRHIDPAGLEQALTEVDGVLGVHDLHVWTITSGFESLSVHARIGEGDRTAILRSIITVARERFGIEHCTVQLEEGEAEHGGECVGGGCG